jgi:hypothetical protein
MTPTPVLKATMKIQTTIPACMMILFVDQLAQTSVQSVDLMEVVHLLANEVRTRWRRDPGVG